MAEIKLPLAGKEESAPALNTCQNEVAGEENLFRHLRVCRTQIEWTFKVPVPLTTEGAINYRVNLLKVELELFSGDTSCNCRFGKHFEYCIRTRGTDDGRRPLYLPHCCKEQARDSIQKCALLPSEVAYKKIELHRKENVVDRSFIDDLLKLLKLVPEGFRAIAKSAQPRSCSQTNELPKGFITNDETVRPRFVIQTQQLCTGSVGDKLRCDRDPESSDLQKLVPREARISRSKFHKLASDDRPPQSM